MYRCVCQCVCVWLAPQSVCISADSALPNPSTLHFFHRLSPLCCALISSPLFIAIQLASSPFASIRHTYLFITPSVPSNPAKKTGKIALYHLLPSRRVANNMW